MSDLARRHCVPCRSTCPPLEPHERAALLEQLPDWEVVDGHHLTRTWRFPDFRTGLRFVDRVGDVADAEDHHPEIRLGWGRVTLDIWTHTIDGLNESDFILAAKCETVLRP
jgi:4a-hydroxytetrahydrobiopterin dehydratase